MFIIIFRRNGRGCHTIPGDNPMFCFFVKPIALHKIQGYSIYDRKPGVSVAIMTDNYTADLDAQENIMLAI